MITLASSDILTWATGIGLVAVLALLVFVAWWAIFSDRAGDRRRCPRCWYDLTYAPEMLCSECGFQGRSEKDFEKTRHRWGIGILAILGCTAIGLFVLDRAATRGWLSYVPARVLVWSLPVTDDPRSPLITELDRRITGNELSPEHWLVLLERCATGDGGARPPGDAWIEKYGGLVGAARARAAGDADETWRRAAETLLFAIPARIDLATRESWPEGVGPTIDVEARDWWPAAAEWRVRATPRLPGAVTDVHLLRDSPIQRRSYSMLVPPLEAGEHVVEIDVAIDRRLGDEEAWARADERTMQVDVKVAGRLGETMTPVSGPEHDEVLRQVFGAGLVKYRSGSLPVRVGVNQPRTFIELFDDTAVGARIEVRRNGHLARLLDIWWRAGTGPVDRQNAWEVPWLDEAILAAPDQPEDVWEVRAYSVPELVLRVDGAAQYWKGEITVTVPIRPQRRVAPPRGWIGESDPFAGDE